MADLKDGESTFIQGSGSRPYEIKNVGGVYSCTCPAWRNQSIAIERRTCKHIQKLRGAEAETARLGGVLPARSVRASSSEEGDEATGPPVLLAERWDNSADLTGWWMSEKLDGVRAYWDGTQFLSRLGNQFHAPDWFVQGLPQHPLDGELWIARKSFQRTVGIVKRQDKTDLWREVHFVVFDAPAMPEPFEARMAFLADYMKRQALPHARAHEHLRCTGVDHLRQELSRVEGLGGEGLMLRQPGSKYESGRSTTLLKVKTFHDSEARVIGHLDGKGRHKGRLGALEVELPDGTRFSVGTGFSDAERAAPPPVGSVITFRYQELSDGGVPRFPSYLGLRADGSPTKIPQPTTKKRSAKTVSLAAAPSIPVMEPGAGRRFECVSGTSSKFWEVSLSGAEMTTRWGRIGTTGQSKTKTFTTAQAAQEAVDALIEEKTADGYVEAAR